MASTSSLREVQTYYDETYVDYRLVWANPSNYAMHFGYYEPGIRRHADALSNANAVLANLAGISTGDRVLDAGCGVGGTSRWLATNRGAQVVGITPVAGQVHKAQRLAQIQGVSDVSFEVDDYTNTAFPANRFDAAVALESLCHAQDKSRFYEEMYRVLSPGGRLVVAEYMRTPRLLNGRQEKLLQSWLQGWAIPGLGTMQEHQSWAERAGFSRVGVEDGSHYARRSLRRLYLLTFVARPIDFALHRVLGWRTKAQSANVRASRDQWRSFCDGHWRYGILTAHKD